MVLVCILSILVVLAIVLYSFCAASSRIDRHIEKRAFLFIPPSFAKTFSNLLAQEDAESIYRIMKALEQRGEIRIVKSEDQIIITPPEPEESDRIEIKAQNP
jgi:hypothetical protein